MSGPGAHSPVGASSIKRIIACPASAGLSQGNHESSESIHAATGTAVHSVIEKALTENREPWAYVGQEIEGIEIKAEHAVAAWHFTNAVREAHPDRNQGNFGVEVRFHEPTVHELFYGTTDAWFLDEEPKILHIWDYKNGAGVVVEVEENEQLMYYAAGVIEKLRLWDQVNEVVLHVVQPNAFHPDGPVREWITDPEFLTTWLEDTCIPAIDNAVAALPSQTASGEHCRFCPVRYHACPQIERDMEELSELVQMIQREGAGPLSAEKVARFLELLELAKIAGKAANEVAFERMMAGKKIPGWKLVNAQVHRKWKDNVEAKADEVFGDDAFEPGKLKSPAEIDKLPKGTSFTAEHAFKPEGGLTIAKSSDKRREVSHETKTLFNPVTAPVAAGRRRPTLVAADGVQVSAAQ